jgi:trimeric autotransporter adhesin
MSTKTTFKRVALVAVAALGLGVLSVAPSSAAVGPLTITVANGTASGSFSDSRTAATVSISGLVDANSDSISVSFLAKDITANSNAVARISYIDTLTGAGSATTNVARGFNGNAATKWTTPTGDSQTASGSQTTPFVMSGIGQSAYVGAKFGIALDSITSPVAGTYTYTVIVKTYDSGVFKASSATDVSIVVAALATASKTISVANSTVFIGATAGATADTAVSAEATADATVDAFITLTLNNAAGGTGVVEESVTATVTGAGVISFDGTTYGKSITHAATAGTASIRVRGDGTAGVSTIAISTPGGLTSSKSVNFFAKAAKTITAAVAQPVLAVGANAGAVSVSAVDANGTNWTGQAYIVASAAADALVAGSATTPVACAAWNSTDGILCPVTAVAAGTAKLKVIDAATVALATATSNEVTVTVSANSPASVKIAFDKATYAPFEKAIITVTPLDKDGKTLQGANRANILATGGITANVAFGSSSDTLTATTVNSSKTTGTDTTAGAQSYVVYMPAQGDITIKATGGTALPLTGQVAVSATASIVNSSVDAATDAANEATDAANAATDAALAAADAADAATAAAQDASDAVAALSASVSKLISSLRAQITSLTNLVIKIQKKVRA